MEERYSRNIGPLTEDEVRSLRTKKVLVAGCGGLGGHIIEMLLRVGIGGIAAADGDVFDETNLNRQLLSAPSLVGKSKAAAAADRAAYVNPDVRFTAVTEFITEGNVTELISGCDAVLDALDSVPARKLLATACEKAGVPLIHGAISGWTAQAALSLPGDGLMVRLYPEDTLSGSNGTLAFTPALCASLQTALCVKYLCGREVEPGKLYCFDLLTMDYIEIE